MKVELTSEARSKKNNVVSDLYYYNNLLWSEKILVYGFCGSRDWS